MPRERSRAPWLGKEPGRPDWYIYWYEPAARRVRRRSAGVDDRGRAEEALGLFIIERARAAAPAALQPPERYKVATALRWYAQERAPGLASAVQASYAVEHLIGFFKSDSVDALTPQRLLAYEGKRPVARGTVRRELAVLSAALAHAVKNGRLTAHPKIILPSPGKARQRHLDEGEIQRLLAACDGTPHLYLFVMLALNTGARRGALLELSWTQVQFEQGLIYLNPEGREETTKGRAIVPISAPLARALKAAHKARTSPFVIEWNGGRILDIKTAFKKACKRAALPGVSPHTLRHTAGSIMAKNGVDIFRIGKMLGHSVQRTTELYAHHQPEWLRGAAAVLGKATKRKRLAKAVALTSAPTKKIRGLPRKG